MTGPEQAFFRQAPSADALEAEGAPDESVAAAADRIDRILFGGAQEPVREPPVAAPQPASDSHVRMLDDFADVLRGPELSQADLLARLATLARDDPQRFERLQSYAASRPASAAEDPRQPEATRARELAELVPEWAEPEAAARGMAEVRQFLGGYGVPASYTDTMSDPREFAIARKAMLYDRAMADRGRLSARRMPSQSPTLAPGAGMERDAADTTLDGLRARLRQSGRLEDAAAVIERMLFR